MIKKLRRWCLTKEGERIAAEGEITAPNDPENGPKKARANEGPPKRETYRAKKRAKPASAIAGDPNVH